MHACRAQAGKEGRRVNVPCGGEEGRRGGGGGRGGDADYSAAGVEQDWLLSHSRASQVTAASFDPRTVLFLPRTDASAGT